LLNAKFNTLNFTIPGYLKLHNVYFTQKLKRKQTYMKEIMRTLHLESNGFESERPQAKSVGQSLKDEVFRYFCRLRQGDAMPTTADNVIFFVPEIYGTDLILIF